MKLIPVSVLTVVLLGCTEEQAPHTPQFSEDFVNNPTDEDYEILIQASEERLKTIDAIELATITVQAFLGAYDVAHEYGRGDEFVSRVKSRAAEAASTFIEGRGSAEQRADRYLDRAYDSYDAKHSTSSEKPYSTQDLIDILVIAAQTAAAANDDQALFVIEGSLIHIYAVARDAGLPPIR